MTFPTGLKLNYANKQKHGNVIVKQGEGVVIEWTVDKAQQIFGIDTSSLSSPSSDDYKNDEHPDVDTVARQEYEELVTESSTVKEPLLTTPSSLPAASTKKALKLDDCLNEFTATEILGGEDLRYCPQCKNHARVSRKIDLWRLPGTLVIHLKRLLRGVQDFGNKIDTYIEFPTTGLDLTDRVLANNDLEEGQKERFIYDLYAVVNHYGGGGGGH